MEKVKRLDQEIEYLRIFWIEKFVTENSLNLQNVQRDDQDLGFPQTKKRHSQTILL